MKRLRIGVIGCGVMGGFHLKQYANINDVEIVGVSDVDPSRAPQNIKFFSDYNELLKHVDAVSITTPTFTHYEVAMKALDAGRHVMIEKPISLTVEQGQEIIKKAKAKKLVLAVGHIERFNPAFRALMKKLGKGKPDIIDVKRMSPLPERIADVSCVIDMMVHDIDLARRIARSEMKYINAAGRKVKTNKLDQTLAVIAFKNGVVANIEASRVHTEKVRKIIVASGKAIYDADLLSKTFKVKTDGVIKDIKVEAYDQLNTELKDFVSAIMKRRKPSVTGEDGLAALEIAQKIEEAALRS